MYSILKLLDGYLLTFTFRRGRKSFYRVLRRVPTRRVGHNYVSRVLPPSVFLKRIKIEDFRTRGILCKYSGPKHGEKDPKKPAPNASFLRNLDSFSEESECL